MLPTRSSGGGGGEAHSLKKRCTRAFLNVRTRLSLKRHAAVALLFVAGLAALVWGGFAFAGASRSSRLSESSSTTLIPTSSGDAAPAATSSSSEKKDVPASGATQQPALPPKPAEKSSSSETPTKAAGGHAAQVERQEAVKKAMKHAWDAYVQHAWGKDELKPVSKSHQNWLDIGLTIVDSLDTLWIMGLKDEFQKARDWVANELSFEKNRDVSTFETSIRVFGGLLSAYDLSRDKMFLQKAKDIGDRLLKAFDSSPLGIPLSQVHLTSGRASLASWTGGRAILSEIGTLQLEYVYLAKHLGEPKYAERVLNIFEVLHKHNKEQQLHGLYPVYVNVNNGQQSGHVTLGALGDSYYEYLLKMWLLTDKKVPRFREMYDEATAAIAERMVKKTTPAGLWYFAELSDATGHGTAAKMDELACFAAGGMFGYGAQGATFERDRLIAKEVTSFCHEMWFRMASGIAPEWVNCASDHDFTPGAGGAHYLLRPETIETYFYMWRLTRDPKYRDWAWEAFQAIERSCRVDSGGYSGVRDVTQATGGVKDDLQQSFFLAETLKYFYMVFSDDSVSLDDVVFGTEAHPVSIFKEPVSQWAHLFKKFDPRVGEDTKS
jgi:hypothetical protein